MFLYAIIMLSIPMLDQSPTEDYLRYVPWRKILENTLQTAMILNYRLSPSNDAGGSSLLSVLSGPISTKNIVTIVLMCCGDIECHPGPEIKRQPLFPCTVCERGVVSRSRALSCDECNHWTHIKCSGCMTSAVYDQLVLRDKECCFLCDKCLVNNLPYNEHTFNLDDDEPLESGTVRTDQSVDGSESDFQAFRKKGLHLIHVNARSLRNKLSDMTSIARKTNASIIAVSETWLDDTMTNNEINIPDYNIIRKDRDQYGGGVCIFVRDNLPFNVRNNLHVDKNRGNMD